ncbi:hypothetical protein V8E36_006323 [Tilletia maclaganii]
MADKEKTAHPLQTEAGSASTSTSTSTSNAAESLDTQTEAATATPIEAATGTDTADSADEEQTQESALEPPTDEPTKGTTASSDVATAEQDQDKQPEQVANAAVAEESATDDSGVREKGAESADVGSATTQDAVADSSSPPTAIKSLSTTLATSDLGNASGQDPLGAHQADAESTKAAPVSPPTTSSRPLPAVAPDSPAPSLPSKPSTPRIDRSTPSSSSSAHQQATATPLRSDSLPPPPPPEKPSLEEVANIAHAFGRELSPAPTPSPRRSTDKALPPTAADLSNAVSTDAPSSSYATTGSTSGNATSSILAAEALNSSNIPTAQVVQGAGAGGGSAGAGGSQPAAEEIPFDFNRFLEQMRHRSANPVGEYVRSFIRGFSKKPYRTADQIRLIFDFLHFIIEKMRETEVWASSSPAEFDNATEAMEKLIMNRLYSLTFTPAVMREGKWAVQTDDLERDRIIKDRILLFSWVRPEHLDIPVSEHTAGFVEFAAQELLKMNNYKAPRDKLICILNCCKVIFGMIRHMATSESADSFIPALIYVVLKANPDHAVSNVEYISRFRSPERLSSEAGYYLSSLAGAISFIETMDHTSLTGVSQEDVERNVDAAVTALALAAPPDPQSTSQSRAGSLSGTNSPFAEEGAKTLQSLGPIAASLADDTRMFFQRTGEAARAGFTGSLGRPIGALGKLFNEGLDGMRTPSPAGASNPGQDPRAGSLGPTGR